MDLHIDLKAGEARSLRARLEHALREAVRSGRLTPGTRLPSSRSLCTQLRVSRGVVTEAYAQLAAEGYLTARRGAGTTVSSAASGARPKHPAIDAATPPLHDMSPFRPALADFPRSRWVAALTRTARSVPDSRLGYPEPAGVSELRHTLASYLGRARGVRSEPSQIVVCSGLRQGISLVCAALASKGATRIAVEHPGWRGIRETATDAGLSAVEVPVDDDGMDVSALNDVEADAAAVAPAHQYPTGAVMSAERRSALLHWARGEGAVIVEDDYDAEYRYDRRPVGCLQGLSPEVVVYGGSASKTLAPAMRLGWLALPERLVEPVVELQRIRGGMPAVLEQLALSDLIERGELDRHLRRQRRVYERRRSALLDALAEAMPAAEVSGTAAGLYVVVKLRNGAPESAALAAARRHGILVEGADGEEPALAVGYANLPETAARNAARALASACAEAIG